MRSGASSQAGQVARPAFSASFGWNDGAMPAAILFDLYNTLVPGGTRGERDAEAAAVGASLGMDGAAFARALRTSVDDRMRGRLGDLPQTLRTLAHRLGADPDEAAVDAACERARAITLELHRATWAERTLVALAQAGIKCALVTDCGMETVDIWAQSPLAPLLPVTSFSCLTGVRKPAAAAYEHALAALRLAPADAWFVGDGDSHELPGAEALGLRAIKFLPPAVRAGERHDPEPTWAGEAITDLHQLVDWATAPTRA